MLQFDPAILVLIYQTRKVFNWVHFYVVLLSIEKLLLLFGHHQSFQLHSSSLSKSTTSETCQKPWNLEFIIGTKIKFAYLHMNSRAFETKFKSLSNISIGFVGLFLLKLWNQIQGYFSKLSKLVPFTRPCLWKKSVPARQCPERHLILDHNTLSILPSLSLPCLKEAKECGCVCFRADPKFLLSVFRSL